MEAGREREERGIRKMYVTTMEHNAALRAFPKAACVHPHAQSIHHQRSCVLSKDFSIKKKEVNFLMVVLSNMHFLPY